MTLTSGERRALTWLLAVIALGAGVRLVAHWGDRGDATPASGEALRLQLLAVDSAQRADRRSGPRRARTSGARRRPAPPGEPAAGSRAPETVSVVLQMPRLERVDVDRADSAELERLPRIGPSLAARIVAERRAGGPFGSVEGLERVRGIGPKLSRSLSALVTFSGTPRPSAVQR